MAANEKELHQLAVTGKLPADAEKRTELEEDEEIEWPSMPTYRRNAKRVGTSSSRML